MTQDFGELAAHQITRQPLIFSAGRVVAVADGLVDIAGASMACRIGDRVTVYCGSTPKRGEVVRLGETSISALIDGGVNDVALDDWVQVQGAPQIFPTLSWLGRVVDPDGSPLDGRAIAQGSHSASNFRQPPPAHQRKPLGPRLETGMAVFNTLLPIVRGQRIGLFAGSGVGKSTLLGDLAKGVSADVVVIGLVGERGREIRQFVDDVLGPDGMKRSVIVAATSDQSPQLRRNCARAATAVAEHFRDQGQHVLLLIDSVTRFCEAHREIALASGEDAKLRGFPASTAAEISGLCERAGTGPRDSGDITAIYSVLVSGSDMEEPVADMLRGVLDGHIVLDRSIAERGRFPAVDALRSVSRSLPAAASPVENDLIQKARHLLAAYDRAELMIQSGLYVTGTDAKTDKAVAVYDDLDAFLAVQDGRDIMGHFARLRQIVS